MSEQPEKQAGAPETTGLFSVTCLKCKEKYEDPEPEDYYCPKCNTTRLAIAAEMDGKFNTRGQQPSGLLAAYDAARGNRAFPTAASLGITL